LQEAPARGGCGDNNAFRSGGPRPAWSTRASRLARYTGDPWDTRGARDWDKRPAGTYRIARADWGTGLTGSARGKG